MKSNLIIALAINDLLDRKVIESNSYIEEKASTPEGIFLNVFLSKEDKEIGNAFLSMQVDNNNKPIAIQLFYNSPYFQPCKKA